MQKQSEKCFWNALENILHSVIFSFLSTLILTGHYLTNVSVELP